MSEHGRIAKFFAPLAAAEPGAFRLLDDAAVLTPPPHTQLVITTDSVIEGVHVLAGASAPQIASKLIRRNLSDLAAMGAKPWCYSLNLHTPRGLSDDWFALFSNTLAEEQARFGLTLIGGDSTAGDGPIHTTLTCYGLLEGRALLRGGAQAGDTIYVSGALGGASLALALMQQHQPVNAALEARYHLPEPRLALGTMLAGVATSAIDISDGLIADATRLGEASNLALTLTREALPLEPALAKLIAADATQWRHALSGGDDYELLFTASAEDAPRIGAIASAIGIPLTAIGSVQAGSGVVLMDGNGANLPLPPGGWEH